MTTTTDAADRYSNRAPKGGAISPVNGVFYAGGRWMPKVAEPAVVARPAPLDGSARQVAWASRLRREALARLDSEIATRRLFLGDAKPIDPQGVRRAIRRDLAARHSLLTERSAAAVIERRAMFA